MAFPDLIPPDTHHTFGLNLGDPDGRWMDRFSMPVPSSHPTLARLLFTPDGHLPILRSFSATLFAILILSHGHLLALVLSPWYYYSKVGLGRLIDG